MTKAENHLNGCLELAVKVVKKVRLLKADGTVAFKGTDQLQIPVPGVMKVGLGNLRCVAGVQEKAEA